MLIWGTITIQQLESLSIVYLILKWKIMLLNYCYPLGQWFSKCGPQTSTTERAWHVDRCKFLCYANPTQTPRIRNPEAEPRKLYVGKFSRTPYSDCAFPPAFTRVVRSPVAYRQCSVGMAVTRVNTPRCLNVAHQTPATPLFTHSATPVCKWGWFQSSRNSFFLHTLWRFLMTFHKVSPT